MARGYDFEELVFGGVYIWNITQSFETFLRIFLTQYASLCNQHHNTLSAARKIGMKKGLNHTRRTRL